MKNLNSDKSYIEKGGILFGTKKDRYYINGSDTHTLVIGATRSGKSRSIVLPTIGIEGLAGENMVVSDPKGELHQYTYPFLEALEYNVFVLDFKNPDRSDHFNFLQEVIDAINDDNIPLAQKKALDITEALVGNDTSSEKIWSEGENQLWRRAYWRWCMTTGNTLNIRILPMCITSLTICVKCLITHR